MSSRQLEDQMEEASNKRIAEILGISEDDASSYVTIDTNASDDGLVYNYIAVFDESTPAHVLEAAGADEGRSAQISVNAFDEEE